MLKKTVILLVASTILFSCEKQTFIVNKNAKHTQMPTTPTYEDTDHQFLWGLVSEKKHNIQEICQGEADIVGTKKTFWDGFFAGITYGLYTPRTYQIQCSGK